MKYEFWRVSHTCRWHIMLQYPVFAPCSSCGCTSAPLYHLQHCCLYTMWVKTIETPLGSWQREQWSAEVLPEWASFAAKSQHPLSPAERIRERDTETRSTICCIHRNIYQSSYICSELGLISHQASIQFCCWLRVCAPSGVVAVKKRRSTVPFWKCQLASGPICVGHSLLDQHFAQRDREKKLYFRVMRLMKGHRATCWSLFPLCYLLFLSSTLL